MDEGQKPPLRQRKKKEAAKKHIIDYSWALKAFLFSFVVSVVLMLLSNEAVYRLSLPVAVAVLVFIVLVGILFDCVGVAVTKAEEEQFHSMAARRIRSAKVAVGLIRNADKVSSICNDIIGDVSGVLSGAIAAAIELKIFSDDSFGFWGKLLFTALVSAIIVGGKATMKGVSMRYANDIVNVTSKVLGVFSKK